MAGSRSVAIPTAEPSRLAGPRGRTRVVRTTLALGLLVTLAAAFLLARGEDVRQAPLVPSGKTGIMVLDISASTSGSPFAQTIEKLAATDERVGLVVFSDAAYELLPPGSPSRELNPLLRYFLPEGGRELPAVNPWTDFRAGTRISEGLRLAREVFARDGVRNGSILLISDFEIVYDEIFRVAEQVALLRREGSDVRLVPLDSTPERRARMNAILGGAALVEEKGAATRVRAPESESIGALAPWGFVALACLLVVLLAVNEVVLARLEVRR